MRPNNNNNRRGRSRGPRKPHGGPHSGMSNKSQGYDGNAAEVRVRGNAYQVLEKYLQLARDAGTIGDRVAAENFLQHADHYYRVVAAMQEGQRPRIGGRDVSVAEVNVQNGSQGLSTALYSGHAQPEAQPDNAGGNNGGGENGAEKSAQGNGQNLGHQSSHQNNPQSGGRQHQNSGHQSGGHQSGGHQGGNYQGGNRQGGAQTGERSGERSNDRSDDRGGSAGFAGSPGEPASPQASYAAPKTLDEQPDYPVDLIPIVVAPAAAADGGPSDPAGSDADRGQDRGPRGPGRGRGRRPARRPRQDGDSGPNTGDSGE